MMAKIQIYQGLRVKDGRLVRGYAAQGTECGKTFILIPASTNSFHIVEVERETVEPNNDGDVEPYDGFDDVADNEHDDV